MKAQAADADLSYKMECFLRLSAADKSCCLMIGAGGVALVTAPKSASSCTQALLSPAFEVKAPSIAEVPRA